MIFVLRLLWARITGFLGWLERSMPLAPDIERFLAGLSKADKAQVLKAVADDLLDAYPGIESRPSVCGGDACIAGTRISVWVLQQARRQGVSESELLADYPTLSAQDLANAWSYVRSHRDEIEEQIHRNEEAVDRGAVTSG